MKEKTLVERKDISTSIVGKKDKVFRFTPGYKLFEGCILESELEKDENGKLIANAQGTDGFKYLLKVSDKNFILVSLKAVNNKIKIIKYGITKVWVE